jgi:ABC-type transport system substrate-binding protein
MPTNYWSRGTLARRTISRRGVIGLAGLGAAFLAACGSDSKEDGGAASNISTPVPAGAAPVTANIKRGGTLRLGTWRAWPGIDPDYSSTGYHQQRVTFDALLGFDEQGVPGPAKDSLATAMETPDKTTIVLKLRPGVKFHDGTDFNAEAVSFNFKRTMATNPPGSVFRGNFLTVDRLDVVDPATVRYTLKQPDASIPAALADTGATMKSPKHYEGKTPAQVQWDPIGTGSYRFNQVSQDSFISYKKAPDHFYKLDDGGTTALLDELRFMTIPNETVIVASLEAGDVDMIEEAPISQIEILEKNPQLAGVGFIGFATQSLYINHALPPMDNVDFRRALMWAWDRNAYNRLFFAGRAKPATSIHPSSSWAHVDVKDFPTFDLEKAKTIMERSGIPPASRKILINAAAADAPQFQFLQSSWEKIGVTSEFVSTEAATGRLNRNRGEKGDIHANIGRLTSRFDPGQILPTQLRQDGIYNYGAAPTGECEELMLKAVQTYDVEERKKLYARVQEIQADQIYSFLPGLEIPFWLYGKKEIVNMRHFKNGRGDYRYLGYSA